MVDWQPLVEAGASFAGFFLWPWLVALWAFAALIERYHTLDLYMRALGWDGIRELLAGFGMSASSMMRARVDALNTEPKPTNVSEIRRP